MLLQLLANEPHRDRAALERTRDLMNASARDCLVTGYQRLIPSLKLPDPNERHVVAAAIVGRCDAIVTCNVKDFPEPIMVEFGIDLKHPDELLSWPDPTTRLCCKPVTRPWPRDPHRAPGYVVAFLDLIRRRHSVGHRSWQAHGRNGCQHKLMEPVALTYAK